MLFDLVCTHMNLIEGDYFGLEFHDHHKMTVSGEVEGMGESARVDALLSLFLMFSAAFLFFCSSGVARPHQATHEAAPT